MYKKIKKWYAQGLWAADMVRTAQAKGVLTAQQAEEIITQEV